MLKDIQKLREENNHLTNRVNMLEAKTNKQMQVITQLLGSIAPTIDKEAAVSILPL